MSLDNRALILSCRATVGAYRRMRGERAALVVQMRRQLDISLEILRRSRSLPGLKYAAHADQPETLSRRRPAA